MSSKDKVVESAKQHAALLRQLQEKCAHSNVVCWSKESDDEFDDLFIEQFCADCGLCESYCIYENGSASPHVLYGKKRILNQEEFAKEKSRTLKQLGL
jgi:ferredoxin